MSSFMKPLYAYLGKSVAKTADFFELQPGSLVKTGDICTVGALGATTPELVMVVKRTPTGCAVARGYGGGRVRKWAYGTRLRVIAGR
jgi:succinyl-CoA synthetase alpha subunit